MKRAALATALTVSLGLASALLTTAASATSGPLAGTWTSVDADGSHQTLTIRGSGRHVYSMTYFDEAATTACDGNPARVSGPGFVDGDDLVMMGTLACQPGGNRFRSRIEITYDYDAGTDTLTDAFGIEWQRAS